MAKYGVIFTGVITGLANGLFGSGGGTIAAPCMQKFMGISPHKSHATTIAVILPLSVVSAVIYAFKTDAPWAETLWVCAGGAMGGFVGARLLNKISSKSLRIIFGAFMLFSAWRMTLC